MKLTVDSGSGGAFLQQPEGTIQAVCCDVVDEGIKTTAYGDKHKLSLRFQSSQLITAEDFQAQGIEVREEAIGQPFLYTSWYTVSLASKSNLSRDLRGWGIEIPDEGAEFDLDSVIGRNALLNVQALPPKKPGDTPFMAVQTVSPLMDGMTPIVVTPAYTRVQDRDNAAPAAAPAASLPEGLG